jgi:hypothetical protein
VSRTEEIRAIFIFGLLAVFAYVKTQYPTLELVYTNGSVDIVPLVNILMILWSVYALFMVLGLSRDTIGKMAPIFKNLSRVFLQYSYFLLAIFGLLYGLVIYGYRILPLLLIIGVTIVTALLFYLKEKTKHKHLNKKIEFGDFKKYRS